MKEIKLSKIFIKLNFGKDIIYRANAWFTLSATIAYLITFILSLRFVTNAFPIIGGYSYDELFILLLLGQMWWYFNVIFARKNFQLFAELINEGKLDHLLMKPINIRRITPFLEFDFRHVPPAIITSILLFYKLDLSTLSLWDSISSLLLFFNGVWIAYSLTAIYTYGTFWSGRNLAVFDLTLEIPELLKIPIEFFPALIKTFFIFLFPIALMVYPTFKILIGQGESYLNIAAVAMSMTLFILSEIIWRKGLQNYNSAN